MTDDARQDNSSRSRIGRMNTYAIEYGQHRLWCRPSTQGEDRAVLLVSIHGPGLPRLVVTPEGTTPLADEECGVPEDQGQIVFSDPIPIRML